MKIVINVIEILGKVLTVIVAGIRDIK